MEAEIEPNRGAHESKSEPTKPGMFDRKLEVVVSPVADVDRAKGFSVGLGWRLDAEFAKGDDFRVVQMTPPGSPSDGRLSGPEPDRRSYASLVSFEGPDGNGCLLQELTDRRPGRVDPAQTIFASMSDLKGALERAAAAHGRHEARIGGADSEWPAWGAEHLVKEQTGEEDPA